MATTGDTGEPLLDRAWSFYHRNDYQRAIQLLREAVAQGVNPSLAEYRLGFCFRSLGQHADAIAHFRESARIDPQNAWACFQAGKVFAMHDYLPAALPEFARAIERDITHADAYHDGAACLGSLGHFEESLTCFTVCAFACEIVVAAGEYTSVTADMIAKATNQLAGFLGDKEFHRIRGRVWRAFGMTYPQMPDRVPLSGFETMRDEVVRALRAHGTEVRNLRDLFGP